MASIYLSTYQPPVLARLSKSDCEAYLERINVPSSTVSSPPSLQLLSTLMLAHHLSVPYDVSNLHVKRSDWLGPPEKQIGFSSGDGMELGEPLFDRIVRRRQSSYCFGLNTLFASLLRGLGFRVSEVGARVFMHRGKDPKVTGWFFSSIVHEVLLVTWPESGGKRYLVDVGFGGGGCAFPILLQDGSVSASVSSTESFWLKQEDLPTDNGIHDDAAPGYTLYRRVLPPGVESKDPALASTGPGYWTACYHFTRSTLCPWDIEMANYYSAHSPHSVWAQFFATSILLKDGSRKTLSFGAPPKDGITAADAFIEKESGERMAKVYVKKGIAYEEEDVRWMKFEVGAIRKVLEEEFGQKFD